MKGKGEKEIHIDLNAEFQRKARRDKKTFLGDQCKEIEENNRMGQTGDLFEKIRDTKGTFHAKWLNKGQKRHGPNIAKDIKKRWQEYTESEVAQLCLTLCHTTDCRLSCSSIHGIFQARVLEWVAISFSRGSSCPRDRTQVSRIVGRCFTI